MKVTLYGTRGSVPVSGPDKLRYGGNTTCLRVESPCIPDGHALVCDGGSGFMPLSDSLMRQDIRTVHLTMTHYHHDHTQGILLSPAIFSPAMRFEVYGPLESGIGPRQALEQVMRPPFHPVSFKQIAARFSYYELDPPLTVVLIFHREGGVRKVGIEVLDGVDGHRPSQINFGKAGRFNINECLVVRMCYTDHPQRTITYRFEERKTNQVFVFVTDHENTDQLPISLRPHLLGANLLIMDSQYTRARYNAHTAGFGHGTPDYCVRIAKQVNAKQLGLTHHDPLASDDDIDRILEEAQAHAGEIGYTGKVFACHDYQEIRL